MAKSKKNIPEIKASKTINPTKNNKTKNRIKKVAIHDTIPINEQRLRMINETAYYFAEDRGFSPGFEITDWLQAEKQIDATLIQ